MSREYRSQTIKIAAGKTEPFHDGPIRFLRIKSITGATSVFVRYGDNGGHFAELQAARKIESAEPVDKLYFKNPTAEEISVEFYALDGFKDADDLISLNPDTPVLIDDSTPVKMTVENDAPISVEQATPTEASQIVKTAFESNTSAATILHTVTAGKCLYLTSCMVSIKDGSGNSVCISVHNGADELQYNIIGLGSDNGHALSACVNLPPLLIPAGYKIKFEKPAGIVDLSTCGIYGYEV